MLLSSTEFSVKLEKALNNSTNEVIIFSAFIKLQALNWLLHNAHTRNVAVVSRWQKHDLVCKASDISCYERCKELGIPFGITLDLHGKVYCIDGNIFVGSANLTSRGMALITNHNFEFGVGFEASISDQKKISNFKKEVLWLDDEIFHLIKSELANTSNGPNIHAQKWSRELTLLASQPVQQLWVHELLFSSPEQLLCLDLNVDEHIHDFELLGLNIDKINAIELKTKFHNTRIYKWLKVILATNETMRFGGLTAALHDAIIDDPAPYRRDVKDFISIIFSWAKFMDDEFVVSRPRYSEILSLKR